MNSARLRVVQPRGSQQPARRSTRTVYFTSSEPNAPPLAKEEGSAEVFLQALDGDRERRLRHVEALGGLAEVQRIRDGQEVPELSQIHRRKGYHRTANPVLDRYGWTSYSQTP